jgi:ribosomal protein L34E
MFVRQEKPATRLPMDEVQAQLDAGATYEGVAKKYGVTKQAVSYLVRRWLPGHTHQGRAKYGRCTRCGVPLGGPPRQEDPGFCPECFRAIHGRSRREKSPACVITCRTCQTARRVSPSCLRRLRGVELSPEKTTGWFYCKHCFRDSEWFRIRVRDGVQHRRPRSRRKEESGQ